MIHQYFGRWTQTMLSMHQMTLAPAAWGTIGRTAAPLYLIRLRVRFQVRVFSAWSFRMGLACRQVGSPRVGRGSVSGLVLPAAPSFPQRLLHQNATGATTAVAPCSRTPGSGLSL